LKKATPAKADEILEMVCEGFTQPKIFKISELHFFLTGFTRLAG
jgi:hypothetical protein